jgi:hypothetical protein
MCDHEAAQHKENRDAEVAVFKQHYDRLGQHRHQFGDVTAFQSVKKNDR